MSLRLGEGDGVCFLVVVYYRGLLNQSEGYQLGIEHDNLAEETLCMV